MAIDDFTKRILDEAPEQNRCPNLKVDGVSPYCAKNLKDGQIICEDRKCVCDYASLQLFCLDSESQASCIFYRGEPFVEKPSRKEIIFRIPFK